MSDIYSTIRWAWRDLRGSWRNFRLVILCLILSLASIACVQIGGNSVLRSIESQANIILGADWVLREMYKPVGEKERAWLLARGAVLLETVEMRVMAANPSTDDSALVELKVIDKNYPLYGEVITDPPFKSIPEILTHSILMDRVLGEKLGVHIGDAVKLGTNSFKLAGWIEKEPDRAGGGRFGLAPRAMIDRKGLVMTGLEQPGSLIYYDLRVRLPATIEQEKLQKEFLDEFSDATWKFTDKSHASPQVQRYVDNLVQFLSLIGLSSLLIGGIGIVNGMRAYFQTRLTTIAIFKSIGMKISQIRLIFIWQIMLIGMTGSLIGLAIGLIITLLLAPLAQSNLPFDFAVSVDAQSLLVPFSFGLLTTFIFALWPLGEAEKSSPLILLRNMAGTEGGKPNWTMAKFILPLIMALGAIIIFSSQNPLFSFFFIGGAVFIFGLFYLMGHVMAISAFILSKKAPFLMRLALQRLGRKGNTTAHTLVSLGIGLTVLVSIASIERNLSAALHDNLPKDAPSFFFLDIQQDQKEKFQELISGFQGASHPIVIPNLRGRIVAVNGKPAEEALIDKRESWLLSSDRGFTFTDRLPAHSEITAGKWWPENYAGPPIISVVDDVQRGFGVKPGDKMTFLILGREIEATIANVREVNWANFTVNFAITFAPGVLDAAPYSSLATVVSDPKYENDLQRAVTRNFPNVTMVNVTDAINIFSDLMGKMNAAVRVMALITLFTGLIVLIESLVAARKERSYETVILKVMGVSPAMMRNILLNEFFLLGLIAAISSAALGTYISWAIMHLWMDLEWSFYPWLALETVVIGVAAIVTVSWLVQRGLLRSSAINFLRNE